MERQKTEDVTCSVGITVFKLNNSVTSVSEKNKETSTNRNVRYETTCIKTNRHLCTSSWEPTNLFSPQTIWSRTLAHASMEAARRRHRVSGAFAGGRRSRLSSQQTSGVQSGGGDASGDVISHQKHRAKLQADPAATPGHDASRSTCQYPFIYDDS